MQNIFQHRPSNYVLKLYLVSFIMYETCLSFFLCHCHGKRFSIASFATPAQGPCCCDYEAPTVSVTFCVWRLVIGRMCVRDINGMGFWRMLIDQPLGLWLHLPGSSLVQHSRVRSYCHFSSSDLTRWSLFWKPQYSRSPKRR